MVHIIQHYTSKSGRQFWHAYTMWSRTFRVIWDSKYQILRVIFTYVAHRGSGRKHKSKSGMNNKNLTMSNIKLKFENTTTVYITLFYIHIFLLWIVNIDGCASIRVSFQWMLDGCIPKKHPPFFFDKGILPYTRNTSSNIASMKELYNSYSKYEKTI